MSQTTPSPQDARASLQEANSRAATVRRADGQFRRILLVITAMYVVIGALLSANPRGGNVLASGGVMITFLAGSIVALYLILRMRAWSRAGVLWFTGSVSAFLLWNGLVIWVSIATGWWGPRAPGMHIGGSVAVAVVPLIIAAWLLGRR